MIKEILLANYWAHFKVAKELALILPADHPRRISVQDDINDIQKQLDELTKTQHNDRN